MCGDGNRWAGYIYSKESDTGFFFFADAVCSKAHEKEQKDVRDQSLEKEKRDEHAMLASSLRVQYTMGRRKNEAEHTKHKLTHGNSAVRDLL